MPLLNALREVITDHNPLGLKILVNHKPHGQDTLMVIFRLVGKREGLSIPTSDVMTVLVQRAEFFGQFTNGDLNDH